MKTKWNLNMLYTSDTDPSIERDTQKLEKTYLDFASKYKDGTYLKSEMALKHALDDWELLNQIAGTWKPALYFWYRKDIDSADTIATSRFNQYTHRLQIAANSVIFFPLQIGKINPTLQKKYLRSSLLKEYNFFLASLFQQAKHTVSEPEEKILQLVQNTSYEMWVDVTRKITSQLTVTYNKNEIPLAEAVGLYATLPTKKRRVLFDSITQKLKTAAPTAEAEINAVVTYKKTLDQIHSFKRPFDSTILSYKNDPAVIETLVDVVTKNFRIAHRFYRLKAKILKEEKLTYSDRNASIGTISGQYDFEHSVTAFKKSLSQLHPWYQTTFNSYLKNGQIDVYPKKGKRGGAYCSGSVNCPTFVFLNHVNRFDSLMTLAHEMGHAFHTELTKENQKAIYQDYSMSTAEVASTLFENFAFDTVFESLSKKEKIIALHNSINDSVQTIFRQIACFNFENELHLSIRNSGYMTHSEIADLMNTHMKSYLGPAFLLNKLDGYYFVDWPHLRYFFYVYSYAYGELVSKALYRRYKSDPTFWSHIETFMKAGGSASPENIFKSIGIDVSDPSFFYDGLKSIEDDIIKLESLL